MKLTEASILNPLLCGIGVVIALVGGYLAYLNMARFEDPEFTIRQAKILTAYPGASPKEVLNEVTEPLETALQELAEVKTVSSSSSTGLSDITVEIRYASSPTKADLKLIWTKVRNKINDAQSRLPPGAGPSIVNDDFGDVFGIYYLITGDGYSNAELVSYARTLRKDLLQVSGVAKVQITGEIDETIYVETSREKAAALGVSLNQVYATLSAQNAVTGSGDVLLDGNRISIDPTGRINSVETIRNLIVPGSAGAVVRLGAIANVVRGYEDPVEKYIRFDGRPAVGVGIANASGTNVVKIGEDVTAKLAALENQRPVGVEISEYYHQGKAVDESIQAFASNVVAALVIVFLTLLFFMGFRSGLVMGATVLITMAATLLIMWVSGIPMHRISLGALIISLGMLVDNGVVVTDGILVGVQQGRKRMEVAREVASQNWKPLLGGTLVGVIAFAPIGFAPGDTAEFTGSLFWVVMIALGLSWLLAFTITPLLCFYAFKSGVKASGGGEDGRFIKAYKSVIRGVVARKRITIAVAFGVFCVTAWGFQFVKQGFFPASTTPQIIVDYYLPKGTDIERTREDMLRMERFAAEQDGVDHVHTLIGGSALRYMLTYSTGSNDSAYGQLLVKTEDYKLNDALIPIIQDYINNNFPDGIAKVWKPILGPGGGPKIEATFSGPDAAELRRIVNQAKAIMAADGDAILIRDDWGRQVPIVEPVYSQNKGERVGVSRQEVSDALQENFSGVQRGVYREGDDLIPIVSRAPAAERADIYSMAAIQIISPVSGDALPLAQVLDRAKFSWRDGEILREDRRLTFKAQCDPAGGVLASDLFARVKPQIEAIPLPPGYALEWDGEFGSSSEAQENLATTIPLGIVAMILVIVILFNTIRQPIVIISIVPLAIVGVTVGLIVTNTPFEFMGILGLLSLSGLLIQNSLVLVDFTDELIRNGSARYDAIIDAAASRLRPVTMGAFTTVLGVIPLFFDAFFRSMTVVIAFGLSFATLITLLVTPATYALLFGVTPDETAASDADGSLQARAAQ
ncbi:MAG: efflux RND transporter permease subunit [Pseudomonadota bacterium]